MILRDYQQAAVDAVWRYFSTKTGDPIVVLPTGTGKSLVAAALITSMCGAYPGTRVLCLTHVKELIENNYETLLRYWPGAPAGIYSAGLKRKDIHAAITFAGIQSIRNKVKLFSRTDIIIIDECHLLSDDEKSGYVAFIAALRQFNPKLKVIGLTATPFRLRMGLLTDGGFFDDVCFDLSSGPAFIWMLEQGYLSPLVPKKMSTYIDTTGVGTVGGDFKEGDLERAMEEQDIIGPALRETAELASDRSSWLIFAASIAQCEDIAQRLNDMGIPATTVHSRVKDRDQRIADFKAGKYRALVNKNILTTGFDHPLIDCIVILRPTKSPGLWVQILGRGTRPVFAPGFDITTQAGRLAAIAAGPKQDCLVLDFARNTASLGPINYPKIPNKKGKGGGSPPVRECPECSPPTYVHISLKCCPECGYEFPVEVKTDRQASTEELVAGAPKIYPTQSFRVDRMMATRHQKMGRPDSVRISYYSGVRKFDIWIGVEHPEYIMQKKAATWWRLHAPKGEEQPRTTDDLLRRFGEAKAPSHIKVLLKPRREEVLDYDFTGSGFEVPTGPAAAQGAD